MMGVLTLVHIFSEATGFALSSSGFESSDSEGNELSSPSANVLGSISCVNLVPKVPLD